MDTDSTLEQMAIHGVCIYFEDRLSNCTLQVSYSKRKVPTQGCLVPGPVAKLSAGSMFFIKYFLKLRFYLTVKTIMRRQ